MIAQVRRFILDEIHLAQADQITASDLPRLRALWDEGQQMNSRFGVPGVNTSADELISDTNDHFFINQYDDIDVDSAVITTVSRKVRRTHGHTASGLAASWLVLEEGDQGYDVGDVLFYWDDDVLHAPVVIIDTPRELGDDTGRMYQTYRYREDLDARTWDEVQEDLPDNMYEQLDYDELFIEGNFAGEQGPLGHALLKLWKISIAQTSTAENVIGAEESTPPPSHHHSDVACPRRFHRARPEPK
jgi:hypothetical protein